MADSDSSSYILRYNLVGLAPEYFSGADWYAINLPPGDLPLANTKIFVGNGSGVAAPVSLSGGATIANTGVLTLTSTAVTAALLTNFSSTTGTVAASDTLLVGIDKIVGNLAATTTTANAALPSASFTDAAVTSKLLTGYVSGAGTVASTDTILQGINKLNGNDALKLPLAGGTTTGTVVFQKAPSLAATALATSGTITPDGTLGPTFTLAVAGAVTLNGPSSPVSGQKVTFQILNDASHSVTLATGAGNFRFGTDITSYTNSVSLTDYIGAIWNAGGSRWDVVSIIQGF